MKRKIYDQLLLWKSKRKGKSVMMIEGARRVGKSYILKGHQPVPLSFRQRNASRNTPRILRKLI